MALKGEILYDESLITSTWADEVFTNTAPKIVWEAVQSKDKNTSDITISLYFVTGDAGEKWDEDTDGYSFWLDGITYLEDSNSNSLGSVITDGRTEDFYINSEILGNTATFYNIPHNEDGSIGEINFSVRFKSNYLTKDHHRYCKGTIQLDSIERQVYINSAPNFNDEESPVVLYTNPSGSLVTKAEICIAKDENGTELISYRDITTSGSSYTFNFTDAER